MILNKIIENIPVNLIHLNPHQPRMLFDDDNISELAESIAVSGLIQPIIVRKTEEGYELVAGERRLRAVKYLNQENISAIIENYNDSQSATIAILENIQRENLSPLEEAIAYQKLIEEHNYTQQELAESLGKSQSTIANKLRLLGLSEKVKNSLLDKKITERHGRALLKIKDLEKQEKILDKIINNKMNVSQTEDYIEVITKPKVKEKVRRQVISKVDYRLELNTIKQTLNKIEQNGVKIDLDVSEEDGGIKIQIFMKK